MIRENLLLGLVLGAGVLVTPWFFGGNLPTVRTIALALSTCMLLTASLMPAALGTPTRQELLFKLILMLGIAWAAIQLAPASGFLSFHSSGVSTTLSIYPAATRYRLCELILGVGVFLVSSHVFRNQRMVAWMFGLVVLNGVLLTFLGLAQTISRTDRLYWYFELTHGGQPFGPFVNGNNAGGYLLMCFSAALFFLARVILRAPQRAGRRSALHATTRESVLRVGVNQFGEAFARLQTSQMYLLAAITVITAGVFASLSRGAVVALVGSILAGWLLLLRKSSTLAIVGCIVVMAGIGLLVWTQQEDSVTTNLASLADIRETNVNRIEHWGVALRYAWAYFPWGSGLGTYSIAYLPFQETIFNRWFLHAENQYLETLAELGLPGLLLLLSAIILAGIACLKLVVKPDVTSRAVGITGWVCLAGQVLAGAFDFGLFMPANMFLMATIMGAVFGQLNWCWSASRVYDRTRPMRRIRAAQLMLILATLGSGWACYEYSAVDARQACRRFYERFQPDRDRDHVHRYQQLAEYAVGVRPDDAEAHYQLALNHVLQFRLESADAMLAEVQAADRATADGEPLADSEAPPLEFSYSDAWDRTTLLAVHRLAHVADRAGAEFIREIREAEPVKQHLAIASRELGVAEECCDGFWFVLLGRAQLGFLMNDDIDEDQYVDDAITKSVGNSEVLYVAGILKLQSGQRKSALKAWNQCLKQTRKYDGAIIQLCRTDVSVSDFLNSVLPTEPYFRIRVARVFFRHPDDRFLRNILLDHSRQFVHQHGYSEAECEYLLGEMARYSENDLQAVQHYHQALELEKHRADWRVNYARSLIAVEMYDQAYSELKVCELYHGDHHVVCQRLMRQVARLWAAQRKQSMFEN